jgi:hypothetical protein
MVKSTTSSNSKINNNTILINSIFISIIYNVFVLGYIINLEDKNCNCFYDWRHDFIKYYSLLLIIWGIISLAFSLYNSKNELVKVITNISMFAYLLNIWCVYSYIGILDYTKCECAITKSKHMHYFLYLFRYVLVGLIILSLLSIIFTLLNKN